MRPRGAGGTPGPAPSLAFSPVTPDGVPFAWPDRRGSPFLSDPREQVCPGPALMLPRSQWEQPPGSCQGPVPLNQPGQSSPTPWGS